MTTFIARATTLKAAAAVLGGAMTFMAAPSLAQAQQFVTIGTGGVTGVYYPAGGAICSLVNQGRGEHGIRCSAESTGGSVFNLNTIREGELDMGVVQSDVQYNALNGEADFADAGPFEELRAVFSLHPEPFTVVARADAGIENFEDLQGKRVNIGNPGSGQRNTMELLMEKYGWTMDDFELASELPSREQAQALCDDNFDAFVFTVGHPSGSISEPVATCDAVLVNVTGDIIDTLVEETPYYFQATIPAGMYNNEEDIRTFGVGATLVSSTGTSADVVYAVTKAVFEGFDLFQGLHPAFAVLDPQTMVSSGNSAPLHEGAERYYQEAGLLE
jgi:TRAP transporter TAXI family solute receptor